MKKFAKSLLCLIMALMLVFAVVGCGEDDSSNDEDEDEDEEETKEVKEEKEEDEEKEDKKSKEEEEEEEPEIDVNGAEEVVEDYISAFLDGDFKEAATYLVDSEDFASDMPTVDTVLDIIDYSKSDFTDEQIAALEASVDKYVSAALDVVDYEITAVEVDGANMEEVVVELVKTTLDEDQMQEIWNELLAADGFESENDLINYLYEDLNSTGNYTSEEDLIRDTSLAYMITFLEVQVSSVIPACDAIEKTVEAVVVYKDGQWLIESIDE